MHPNSQNDQNPSPSRLFRVDAFRQHNGGFGPGWGRNQVAEFSPRWMTSAPPYKGPPPGYGPATQPKVFPPALRQETRQPAPPRPAPNPESRFRHRKHHRRHNQRTPAQLAPDCATRHRAGGIRHQRTPQAGFLISQSSPCLPLTLSPWEPAHTQRELLGICEIRAAAPQRLEWMQRHTANPILLQMWSDYDAQGQAGR